MRHPLCLAFALAVATPAPAADPKGKDAPAFDWAATGPGSSIKGRFGGTPTFVQFSPDGKLLAVAGLDNKVTIWHGTHGSPGPYCGLDDPHTTVGFSPDGKWVTGTYRSGSGVSGTYWDLTKPDNVYAGRNGGAGGGGPISAVTADGRWVVSVTPNGRFDVNSMFPDPPGPRPIRVSLGGGLTAAHTLKLTAAAAAPNARALVTASQDKSLLIWNAVTLGVTARVPTPAGAMTCVDFSPDSKRVAAAGSPDNAVYQFDAGSGKKLATFTGHRQAVHTVAYSPDGKLVASAGADPGIKIWEAATGKEVASLEGHKGVVKKVAFSPDGARLASAGGDCVILWTARPK